MKSTLYIQFTEHLEFLLFISILFLIYNIQTFNYCSIHRNYCFGCYFIIQFYYRKTISNLKVFGISHES